MIFNLYFSDVHGAWRTSLANKDHKLCPTYPSELLVPALISDAELEKCASFRSAKRLPAVVWRHKDNGTIFSTHHQKEMQSIIFFCTLTTKDLKTLFFIL